MPNKAVNRTPSAPVTFVVRPLGVQKFGGAMRSITKANTKWTPANLLCAICLLVNISCNNQSTEPKNIRFIVKNMKCEISEYGKRQLGGSEVKDISYTHTGTIVTDGSSKSADGTYIVFYEISRISGGDPNNPRRSGSFGMTIVKDGIGDLVIGGGYQRVFTPPLFADDVKPWNQEIINVKIVGYTKITQQDSLISADTTEK